MALFCAYIKRDSICFLGFPSLSHVQVFSWEMLLVCGLRTVVFLLTSFLVIALPLIFVLSVLFRVAVISRPLLFWYSPWVIVSIYEQYPTWRRVLHFLTHWIYLYHIWDVTAHASSICRSSSLFLFKNGPEYLTGGQNWFWWDTCNTVWF